ncbi:DUF1572 domain-containing protein [Reichenbachiella agarivorans]|uniref:DUF1572 domain-containing protein n=1 Tax=Reichenbachiella agarivorans TaxID=2979464 RepID=A0ABY6CRZ6_9BACT|nr:DUF1572 domain-containing protein [Reichenbachiella agarivorans]UXP33271.1 DUF1572 domain-containing protein [Reichenbachiella agarivorans]
MSATVAALKSLFELSIDRLAEEIQLYKKESQLWDTQEGISNSAGNLTLHLCGNLQHFFGAVISQDGYVRDREGEFSRRNVPRTELLSEIARAKSVVLTALDTLDEKSLAETYPLEVFGSPMTCAYFLTRLYSHIEYHLGQINYLRRLIG